MSTTYGGTVAIASIANTAGVGYLVTTSTAHGYAVSDAIRITGVTGNAQTNGKWTVATTPTTTTFTLVTSNATAGSSGASGTITVYRTQVTIPSDGDQRNAASVNPAFQGLQNDIADLNVTRGAYYLAAFKQLRAAAPASVIPATTLANILNLTTSATTQVNDIIETSFSADVVVSLGTSTLTTVNLAMYENFAGAGYVPSIYTLHQIITQSSLSSSFSFVGYTLVTATEAGSYLSQLWAAYDGGGGTANCFLSPYGAVTCVQKIWRPS